MKPILFGIGPLKPPTCAAYPYFCLAAAILAIYIRLDEPHASTRWDALKAQ